MPFNNFSQSSSSQPSNANYPFKVNFFLTTSGIDATNFQAVAPCDDNGIGSPYTSRYLFNSDDTYPVTVGSGVQAFSVYSGSCLYKNLNVDGGATGIVTSYPGNSATDFGQIDCQGEENDGPMRIYGLNKNILLRGFQNQPNTIKLHLATAYPLGSPSTYESTFKGFNIYDTYCQSCLDRANEPISSFLAISLLNWLPLVSGIMVNKSVGTNPRFEKRSLISFVPIAEISNQGVLLQQYLTQNVGLVDMCFQGIPAKIPLPIFAGG